MNKHQSDQGRLDSSATHRLTQPSTILDRRYVKRPTASNAGKYNSSSVRPRIERNVVAPSRLINLGVHNQDLMNAIDTPTDDMLDDDFYDEPAETMIYDYSEDAASAELAAEMDETDEMDEIADEAEDEEAYYAPTTIDEVLAEEETATDTSAATNQTYSTPENSYSHDSAPYSESAISYSNTPELYSQASASYYDTNNSYSTPNESYSNMSSMYADMMSAYAHGYYTNTEEDTSADINNNTASSSNLYAEPDKAALDKMKQSMMQDLVNNISTPDESAEPIAENTNYTSYTSNYATPEPSESIDAISRATSDALASIRMATDSADVSDQLASIKAFASSIKSDPSPEMAELGNTIEKFTNVALKSTKAKEAAEHKVAASVNRSSKISASTSRINRAPMSATSRAANTMNLSTKSQTTLARNSKRAINNKLSTTKAKTISKSVAAKSIDRAPAAARRALPSKSTYAEPSTSMLEQAVRSISSMDDTPSKKTHTKSKKVRTRRKGGAARFLIAFGCAAACIGGIVYLVSTNIPDISVQVAAMQTGIEASYPSYIPRDYSLGDIFSENGRLTMRFDGPDNASFTLVEEKSSWDSSALQRNFVDPTWKDNYTTTHEQGITIYICGSDAAWVNGGVLYKITASNNNLTKKQLRNIVTSL